MDLIIGMGEVGSTLYRLFESKKIGCSGYDIDKEKCRDYPPTGQIDVLHIACPYFEGFERLVLEHINKRNPHCIMIHSTVPIGTASNIQKQTTCTVVSCPARGRHDTFLADMMKYTKFYAFDGENPNIWDFMHQRFNAFKRAESTTALEMAKIMCDTTYLGLLIAYRKYVDEKAESFGISDKDRMWEFAKEAHDRYGNRPIMYNDGKKIGGHCVLPNLTLLSEQFDIVSDFIKKYGG